MWVCLGLRPWKMASIFCFTLANMYNPLDIISIALTVSIFKDADQLAIGSSRTKPKFP